MATSCAIHVRPKNGQGDSSVALETWPDTATDVFFVPSQVKWTSLVPPDRPPVGSNMVKLLFAVSTPPVPQPGMAVPEQTPPEQTSCVVQAFPSSQDTVFGVCVQFPAAASQE